MFGSELRDIAGFATVQLGWEWDTPVIGAPRGAHNINIMAADIARYPYEGMRESNARPRRADSMRIRQNNE
jgi:hypothetical protein